MKKTLTLYFCFTLILLLFIPFSGSAQQGTGTCADPTVVPELKFDDTTKTTCGLSPINTSASCLSPEYFGGEAYVYSYTPSKDMQISVEVLLKDRPPKGGVAILDACPDQAGAQCLQSKEYNEPLPDKGNTYASLGQVPLLAGRTYYIIVAGGKCTESGQGTNSLGCLDDYYDAVAQCPCGEVDYAENFACNTAPTYTDPDYYRAEYWCICPANCTLGENFCSDFTISVTRNPFGEVENSNDCSNDNLGFENGNMSNWQASVYDGDNNFCNPDYFPNDQCAQPQCFSCFQASCKDPDNFDMCPETPNAYNLNNAPTNAVMTECRNHTGAKTNARFSLMTGGTDPNTDGNLPMAPPNGSGFSVRLGNQGVGYQAECMWNEFVVTELNKLLVYQYAMVLQDPNHPMNQHNLYDSPRFLAALTDLDGNPVGCGNKFSKISLQARDLGEGFEKAKNPQCNVTRFTSNNEQNWSTVYYKPWTTVGVDLSQYMGQTLRLKFCTADCGRGGHYSYAYIDVFCIGPELGTTKCVLSGESVTFAAPPGFTNYRWYEGTDTSGALIGQGEEIDIPNPTDGTIYTVSFSPLAGTTSCPRSLVRDTVRVIDQFEAGDDTTYCIADIKPGDEIQLQLKNLTNPNGLTINWSSIPGNWTSNEVNPVLSYNDIPRENTQFIVEVTTGISAECSYSDTVYFTVENCEVGIELSCDTVCQGSCPGEVTAQITIEGEPPYQILWSDPNLFVNDSLGPFTICPESSITYGVTIIDSRGLRDSAVGCVEVLPPPTIQVNKTDTRCNFCEGTASATPSGTGPFTYEWNTGANTSQITGLCAGTYAVTITDEATGCQDSSTVTIIDSDGPEITATGGEVSCFGECSGTATATVTKESAPPYSFVWDDPNSQTTPTATGLCIGTYNVTISDSNGCVNFATATITGPPDITAQVTPQNLLCFEENTGSVELTVSGGTLPYTYSWSNSATTQNINNLPAGDYSVTVTDSNGCFEILSATLTQPPQVSVTVNNDEVCEGNCDAELTATPQGGTPPYSFVWNNTGNSRTQTIQNLCVGEYIVTITDANGCTAIDTGVVTDFPPPENHSWKFLDCPGELLKLPSSDGGIKYRWSPSTRLSSSNVAHPITRIKDPITYTVTITHPTGCNSVDTVRINIKYDPSYTLHIPNSFTPNGDGNDDFFEYTGDFRGLVWFECQIWNRWGERIYQTFELTDYWNGRYNNIGEYVKDGAYVYIIRAKDDCALKSNTTHTRIGWVIVLKGDS